MKKYCIVIMAIFSMFLVVGANSNSAENKAPVKIIFDTDMGNDVDDALALAMLYNYDSRNLCKLIAVTLTKSSPSAGPYIQMMNEFYGYPNIPVGTTDSGVEPKDGRYIGKVIRDMGFDPAKDKTKYVESYKLLRQILAKTEGKVVIAQVGFSTSLARLLDSKADEYSPLSGKDLMKEKVEYVCAMAGGFGPKFQNHKEYNVVTDIPSAKKFFAECPVPIIVTGFEVGYYILYNGKNLEVDNGQAKNPLRASFSYYRGGLDNNQMTWDLTAVLYAVYPDKGFFGMSEPGTVVVNDDGTTTFTQSVNGNHRLLTVTPEQIKMIEKEFIDVCNKMPKK